VGALVDQMLHVIRTLALAIHQHSANQNFPMDAQSLSQRLQSPPPLSSSPSSHDSEVSESLTASLSDEKTRQYAADLEALVKEMEEEEEEDQDEGGIFVDEAEEDEDMEKKLKAQLKGLPAAEKWAKRFFQETRYPFLRSLDLIFLREERRILAQTLLEQENSAVQSSHEQQEGQPDNGSAQQAELEVSALDKDAEQEEEDDDEDEDNDAENSGNEDEWDPRYLRTKIALQLADWVHVDEPLSTAIRIHTRPPTVGPAKQTLVNEAFGIIDVWKMRTRFLQEANAPAAIPHASVLASSQSEPAPSTIVTAAARLSLAALPRLLPSRCL
jgi:hypothetical protein